MDKMTKDRVFMKREIERFQKGVSIYVFPCTKRRFYQIGFGQKLPFSDLTQSDSLKGRDF